MPKQSEYLRDIYSFKERSQKNKINANATKVWYNQHVNKTINKMKCSLIHAFYDFLIWLKIIMKLELLYANNCNKDEFICIKKKKLKIFLLG